MHHPLLFPLDLRGALLPGPFEAQAAASAALVEVAGRFARSFAVVSPWAPGLSCVGGEVALDPRAAAIEGAPRISATGNGATLTRAVLACLGEAADLVSQYERPGDVAAHGRAAELDGVVDTGWIGAAASCDAPLDWVAATIGQSGSACLVPADLCLRRDPGRREIDPVGPLSAGAAAGPTREAAAVRAILELCERDALALWWLGGRRARGFPDSHAAAQAGRALLDRLREGRRGRTTSLLDIGGDLAVPVVAAISLDADGHGLACGAAARLDAAEAAEAAVLELCQMEMSAPLAAAKRAQAGESALNQSDLRHLRRAAWQAQGSALLAPLGLADSSDRLVPAPEGLADLLGRLDARGIVIHLVDLTRADIGVPVVRALAPQLQPFAAGVSTARLGAIPERSDWHASGADIPLF